MGEVVDESRQKSLIMKEVASPGRDMVLAGAPLRVPTVSMLLLFVRHGISGEGAGTICNVVGATPDALMHCWTQLDRDRRISVLLGETRLF